jgi:hypothetical protein
MDFFFWKEDFFCEEELIVNRGSKKIKKKTTNYQNGMEWRLIVKI